VRGRVQEVEGEEPVLDGCARLRSLHRSPLLSVDLWRCVEDGDGLKAERRHTAPVLSVLLSGASVLQESGRAIVVEAGTALLAYDLTYRSTHPFGCVDTGCHVRPSPRLLEGIRLPREHMTAVVVPTREHLRFRRAIEKVSLAGEDGLDLEESCLSLLAAATEPPAREAIRATPSRHIELVEAAKILILQGLGEPMPLDALSRAVGASPFHLARTFRRLTGLSLHGYRTRMRLLHALDRLETSRGALADLALELGFSSQSHFTDAFRAAFGGPPSAVGHQARIHRRLLGRS
jgi:AraC family transcriptional regulator